MTQLAKYTVTARHTWSFKAGVALLLTVGAITCLADTGQALATGHMPSRSSQVSSHRPDRIDLRSFKFAIGDRLKITFFEQYESDSGPGASNVLSALVERSEMTGEHIVQQDGSIFLPLLGTVHLAGQTHEQFQEKMRAEFASRFDGQVKINVEVLEREPIYITGAIPQPGAFKHVPGMTILHAMILAGSFQPGDSNRWQQLDLMRERERMRKSEERLKDLLARYDVLLAERSHRPAQPSQQLIDLAGASGAAALIVQATRLHEFETNRIASQNDAYDAIINAADHERAILQQSVMDAESRMKELSERIESMSGLRDRGVVTEFNFQTVRTEANSSRQRWNDTRAAMAGIERSLREFYQAKIKIAIDAQVDLERELKETRLLIAEEEISRTTMGNLLQGVGSPLTSSEDTTPDFEFQIVRRQPSGVELLPAEQMTTIEPGDIVRVITIPKQLQAISTH